MKTTFSLRRVFILAGVASLLVVYALLWLRTLTDITTYTGADFMAFYAAGRISAQEGFSHAYDMRLQKTVEEGVAGFTVDTDEFFPFGHPPFILPILAVLGNLDYLAAFSFWAMLVIVLLFVSNHYLVKSISFQARSNYWVLAIGALLFFPSFVSILNGQDSALLLLGGALWLYGFTRNDDRLTGIGLALTTIRPHIALLLAIPFLFNRRGIWWWFCAGAAALVLISVALLGISGTLAYIEILTISAGGEGYKLNESAMVNLIGLLHRALPALGPEVIRATGWGIYALALLSLILLWARSRTITDSRLGVATIMSLLAAPHLHYHDLALLLIPVFIALRRLQAESNWRDENVALVPLALTWIFVVSNFNPTLKFGMPYIIMTILVLFFWKPQIFTKPVGIRTS